MIKMKGDKKFLNVFIWIFAISIILGLFLEIKLTMVILFSLLLIAGIFIYKEKIGQELIVAFLIALILTSYYIYQYIGGNVLLGKINLFPLISWTFGLVLLKEIYERTKIKNKLFFVSGFYVALLFLLEYVGYYLLKIRLNTDFPSLFGLGIIHAPIGMKIFYLFAGPVYLIITDYLKLK